MLVEVVQNSTVVNTPSTRPSPSMSGADAVSKLPGVKHKVIGLVSGGKDSCFNMMHTVANGHKIVALATLTPEPGIGELPSCRRELTIR